jgi:hypothetical protein
LIAFMDFRLWLADPPLALGARPRDGSIQDRAARAYRKSAMASAIVAAVELCVSPPKWEHAQMQTVYYRKAKCSKFGPRIVHAMNCVAQGIIDAGIVDSIDGIRQLPHSDVYAPNDGVGLLVIVSRGTVPEAESDAFRPTSAAPGSPEKVEVMVKRAALGHPLWHEGDATIPMLPRTRG